MPAGKTFVDTNILAYAQDADSHGKREQSRRLIAALAASGLGVISTQVLQEYYVTATGKLGVAPLAAKAILRTFDVFEIVQISPRLIEDAIDCSILNQLAFWDALIVTAAAVAGCGMLCSEDFNPGQRILGVRIENPFER
jgi:predicted nucleic acid-binding protein